jgi:hypothetical protein
VKVPYIIATDFDGTICESKWPEIGAPNLEVIDYLKDRKEHGAKLILFTCREGKLLADAVNWCAARGLFFDSFNENLPEVIELYGGRDCRKISADEYLDDKSCTKFKLPFIEESRNYIQMISKMTSPPGELLLELMDRYDVNALRYLTIQQARDFYYEQIWKRGLHSC